MDQSVGSWWRLPIRTTRTNEQPVLRYPPILAQLATTTDADIEVTQVYELYKRSTKKESTVWLADEAVLVFEAVSGEAYVCQAKAFKADVVARSPQLLDASVLDLSTVYTALTAQADATSKWTRLSVLHLKHPRLPRSITFDALAALERRCIAEPGLYYWQAHAEPAWRLVQASDEALHSAAQKQQAILVVIHGLGANIESSFADLTVSEQAISPWEQLNQQYQGRIYGFNHATFSASPIENALQLVQSLPKHSLLHIVSHSRGGLIADLLVAQWDEQRLEHFQQASPIFHDTELAQLKQLAQFLQDKALTVQRYVRVACPAQGTALAERSAWLLSVLLSLANAVARSTLVLQRLSVELIAQGVAIDQVPGLAVLQPHSALSTFLSQLTPQPVQMAVLTANTEDSSGLLLRLANYLSDALVFTHQPNDLVVETASMRGGLAASGSAYEFFAENADVHHFNYFRRPETQTALVQWLAARQAQEAALFKPLTARTTRTDTGSVNFFTGTRGVAESSEEWPVLTVSVRAMDLRFSQQPILCGHYEADAIAGAERQIDTHIVQGALSQRERLGIYVGPVGTQVLVLPQCANQSAKDQQRGALIIGLGEWSLISTQAITYAVRNAVLKYLLQVAQTCTEAEPTTAVTLTLNSLLIGNNSTTHITVEASMEAIVRGVAEANQQYRYNQLPYQANCLISHVEFIELYLDTAMSAAYALRQLPQRLERDLSRLQFRLQPATELAFGQGMRHRLSERSIGSGYWPRLMVSQGDQLVVSLSSEMVIPTSTEEASTANLPPTLDTPAAPAQRLRYVYLSERARAEALIQQRQPGLIEALIRDAIRRTDYQRDISRTLFQLLVPLDFKAALRQTDRLLLIVDGYAAAFPWEMLQADEEPLVVTQALVRQLVSTRYRQKVNTSPYPSACVIGNPATTHFYRYFPQRQTTVLREDLSLVSLSGAAQEARVVATTLRQAGYDVVELTPTEHQTSSSHSAVDVFNALFRQSYRIVMIAAHGEVNLRGKDGRERTGVILSDGVLLTAAELGQLEDVPDLVFLNCCHLAKADSEPLLTNYNQLAYSLSRELIEMGVRCVIAAGWAVDDQAASVFSTTFFTEFVEKGLAFGRALWLARKKTWEQFPTLNTWGAYQAYGDPNYVLEPNREVHEHSDVWSPMAAVELQDRLQRLELDLQQQLEHYTFTRLQGDVEQVLQRTPAAWVQSPDIQYRLARLYGALLPDGFAFARAACQLALAGHDQQGLVPLDILEWLAHLEARQASLLERAARVESVEGEQAVPANVLCQQAFELMTAAIQHLEALLALTDLPQQNELTQGNPRRKDLLRQWRAQQARWAKCSEL